MEKLCRSFAAILLAVGIGSTAFAVSQAEWEKILDGVQYKRYHVAILETGLEGDWAAALEQAEELDQRIPDDPETAFIHAVVHAQRGDTETALEWCERAKSRGLDPGRLAAEAHNLLAPLAENEAFLELTERVLVHGPMLGNVTDTGASVWVRTADQAEVELTVSPDDEPRHAAGTTRAEEDFTAVLRVEGLDPATEYSYMLRIGGKIMRDDAWRFTTSDPDAKSLRVAFGGGAGYTPENERMWDTVRGVDPDLLLLLGDNVYIDNPTHPEIQRYCYYRRQSRPEFQRLVCQTPVYAIWDDHDFGVNDCWYGTDPEEPAWKPDVLEVFRQNWVNPAYGGEDTRGVWFAFDRGPVRVIMTDGRYYRSNPEVKPSTMLGDAQKTWLIETLRNSTDVPFVLLASGVPWSPGTKGSSLDTWDGFPEEREEIFTTLDTTPLKHLLLISADRHRSDIWKIDRPGSEPLYEFESSRLTNKHVHQTMDDALFSYNELQSFGMIEFEAEGGDKGMQLTIVNINGEKVHTMHLPPK